MKLVYDKSKKLKSEEIDINQEFEIGDYIVGLPEADRRYRLTAPKNNFIGEVIDVRDDAVDNNNTICVEMIEGNEGIGLSHWLNPRFFTKMEEE